MMKEKDAVKLPEVLRDQGPTAVEVVDAPDDVDRTKDPRPKRRKTRNAPACIEYHGVPGATRDCMNAVLRLIQYGNEITRVQILTPRGAPVSEHCLLLTYD